MSAATEALDVAHRWLDQHQAEYLAGDRDRMIDCCAEHVAARMPISNRLALGATVLALEDRAGGVRRSATPPG